MVSGSGVRWPGFALAVAACLGCGDGSPRVVEDLERGCRYTVPSGWQSFDGEARSPGSSLFTIRVFSLEGADPAFVAQLPDSIVPQLEAWARNYYILGAAPARSETVVGGEPAQELRYPVRVRVSDPERELHYWIVRHGSRLYVLRATYSPKARDEDERAVRAILASLTFLEDDAKELEELPGQAPTEPDNPNRSPNAN